MAQHLTQGWQRVDTIDIAITPGGKSEVGRSVIEAILSYVGKEVPVAVLRDGDMEDLTVVLGRRETSEAVAFPASSEEEAAPEQSEILGLTLSEIAEELTDQYSLSVETGLVITAINPDSEAASKGLLEGDVITEAGQEAVATIADLEERIEVAMDALYCSPYAGAAWCNWRALTTKSTITTAAPPICTQIGAGQIHAAPAKPTMMRVMGLSGASIQPCKAPASP